MSLKNSSSSYGALSKLIHWSIALLVIGLFASGFWMTGLGYYDDWYHEAPELHKSFGVILLFIWLARLGWLVVNAKVEHPGLKSWEILASKLTQQLMQLLVIVVIITGYLMSTADGRAVPFFELFEIPAIYEKQGMEDFTGWIHEIVAYVLIGLAAGHGVMALKHHFINGDSVLKSMLPKFKSSNKSNEN